MTDPAQVHQGDRVDVTLPLDTRFGSTLRLLCASLAADADFTVDEIDDLRLAVSEVFAMMVSRQPGGRVTTSFFADGGSLTVQLTHEGAAGEVRPDELARNILDAVVDTYRFEARSVTLTKFAVEARSA
jgi:serine/threonine-protein kinase RsbW